MNSTPQQILNRFQQLRSMVDAGQISREQFVAEIQKLQMRDETGTWWTIDAASGRLMRFDGRSWAPASAPPAVPASGPRQAPAAMPAPARRPSTASQKIVPFLGLIVSFGCGGLWALYTMLRIGEGEAVDLLTPIIMVALPLVLWFVSKPIDKALDPWFVTRDQIPQPLLIGAALALPFVLGIFLSAFSTSGYGAMRWTAFLSITGAYLLTRKRQVFA